jgi:hypothetical protein
MLPTKIWFIWPNGFRREESKKSVNQEQESPVAAMFVNGSGRNEQSLGKAVLEIDQLETRISYYGDVC